MTYRTTSEGKGRKRSAGLVSGTKTYLSPRHDMKGPFNGRLGFGTKPVVLVVDFMRAYTTPRDPFYAPMFVDAVHETADLLTQARLHGVPVIYTRVEYDHNAADGGLFVEKIPSLRRLARGSKLGEIVSELKPYPDDIIIKKQYASSFFGTPLSSILTSRSIDTIILTGCSTSGCIRATAVDGLQYGFRVMIPQECVADRRREPHEANLFDIDSKYGDVVRKNDVLKYFKYMVHGRS